MDTLTTAVLDKVMENLRRFLLGCKMEGSPASIVAIILREDLLNGFEVCNGRPTDMLCNFRCFLILHQLQLTTACIQQSAVMYKIVLIYS